MFWEAADLCRPGGAAAGRPMLSASSAPAPAPAHPTNISTLHPRGNGKFWQQAVVWRTVPGRSGFVGGLMRLVAAENGGGGWI